MFPSITSGMPVSLLILIIIVSAFSGAGISGVIFYLRFKSSLDANDHQQEIIIYLQGQVVRFNIKEVRHESEIVELKKTIEELSRYVDFSRQTSYPLLAVIGTDEAVKDDLMSLRQTGVDTLLSFPPTLDAFERRLNHLRASGRMPKGVHFGLHAGSQGIDFEDKLATTEWLSENLSGIEVILISGCRGSDIGFALSSDSQRVVTVQHDIESHHASLLTKVFWGQVASGKNVVSAFAETKRRLPLSVSELIELH